MLAGEEGVSNRIRYTGQQYDEISEQYYLRARYYNPVVGRFLQEDVYEGDGLNLYAYCGNNPVRYYDPSGYAYDESKTGGDGGEGEKPKGKRTGRGKNKLMPDPNATGSHSTFKRDPITGEITNYKTYQPNPRNPSGFDEVIGYDGVGTPHKNPVTDESLMPHMHDKSVPGKVRSPRPEEIPKKLK